MSIIYIYKNSINVLLDPQTDRRDSIHRGMHYFRIDSLIFSLDRDLSNCSVIGYGLMHENGLARVIVIPYLILQAIACQERDDCRMD